MSIELNLPFNTPSNYIYNDTQIEIAAGVAKLLLQQGDIDFIEDFADDTGFTYDSDKSEFVAGRNQQKSIIPNNETFFSKYTSDINGTRGLGILTGLGFGSPVISNGELILTSAQQQYVDYNANLNADSQQEGCIELEITPDWNGNPISIQYFFCISRENDDGRNLLMCQQNTNGDIYLTMKDYQGNTIQQPNLGTWTPVSGTKYKFSFNFSFTAPGQQRLFINGVLFGGVKTNLATRDENINLLRIGSNVNPNSVSNFKVDNLQYFSTVQHTTNYTPSEAQQYEYFETSTVLPEMEHIGDGIIKLFNSFSLDYIGTPRVLLEIGRSGNKLYWDGDSWEISDNSYAQATDPITFNTNASILPVDGENYGQFTIVYPNSDIQSSVNELTVNTNVDIGYLTTNPTIEIISGFRTDELEEFLETSTKIGNDEIKYIIKKESSWYYWDGTEWSISDGTYAQSNTATEIETNKSSLIDESTFCYLKFFLHSGDGTTSPENKNIKITYSFGGGTPDAINTCIVWGYNYDLQGNPEITPFKVRLNKYIVQYNNYTSIRNEEVTVTPDSVGYWEVELIENENMTSSDNAVIKYIFDFGNTNIFIKIVPNEETKAYNELE